MKQIILSLTLIAFIQLIFGIAHGDIIESWKSQRSGTTEELGPVYFIDDKTGWVVGGFGKSVILHTSDGGENWLTQNNPWTEGRSSWFAWLPSGRQEDPTIAQG